MRPGDHFITNDPWLGTGHLHDLTVVTPAFHAGRMVGLFANTAHIIDIGGLGMGPEGRSVFEEGLYIPIVKCFDAGSRTRPSSTSSAPDRARRSSWRAMSIRYAPAMTPAPSGSSR
jgi:N-methylhydantoinase B